MKHNKFDIITVYGIQWKNDTLVVYCNIPDPKIPKARLVRYFDINEFDQKCIDYHMDICKSKIAISKELSKLEEEITQEFVGKKLQVISTGEIRVITRIDFTNQIHFIVYNSEVDLIPSECNMID